MKIQIKPISEVMPYFNNPRNNRAAIEPVAESIKRYGFVKPIIVDKDNVIIAGHTRFFASQLLGLDTIPVVVSDMDEHKAQMYRIIDNKVAEKAFYDDGKLMEELKSMNLESMQTFFFEDLLDMVGNTPDFPEPHTTHSYQAPTDVEDYIDTTQDDYSAPISTPAQNTSVSDPESTEAETSTSSPTDNLDDLDDLFEPRIVNGERVMKVYCPYCKHIEVIKL